MTAPWIDSSDYVPLVNLIAIFFQIRDDYMNLQSTEVRVAIVIANGSIWKTKDTAKT